VLAVSRAKNHCPQFNLLRAHLYIHVFVQVEELTQASDIENSLLFFEGDFVKSGRSPRTDTSSPVSRVHILSLTSLFLPKTNETSLHPFIDLRD
jgi:hypothetical protein